MTQLHVFKGLSLPKELVTQTLGILAIRGVGKTYLEMKIVEELFKASLQTVSIDSMGVFWGLRAAADGKSPGLPITIFGGEHADVPLVPTAGAVVAELLARENIPAILDISDFRKNEQRRFVTDFAETFYHEKKKHRHPVHVLLDEADLWAPQRPEKGWERLLGAVEDLVRRGRARGIGVTMATQRAAVLNKDVLSQIAVLVAMQMSSPHDIDAADYWVKNNGTREKRDELMGSIASLEKGEAWVWSPAWIRVFKRARVLARETFDSSKTPEVGEKIRAPKRLASVDIAKVKKAIEATVEYQKSDDPKLLKTKIGELQRNIIMLKSQVALKPAPVPKPVETVKTAERPVIYPKELVRLEKVLRELSTAAGRIEQSAGSICGYADVMRGRVEAFDRKQKQAQPTTMWQEVAKKQHVVTKIPVVNPEAMKKAGYKTVPTMHQLHDAPKLRTGEREILRVCCQIGSGASEAQLGVLSGFPAGGSTFKTYLNLLKRKGLLGNNGITGICPTDLGKAVAGPVDPMPTDTASLVELWKKRLRNGEGEILDLFVARHPKGIARCDIVKNLDPGPDDFQHGDQYTESTIATYVNTLKRCGLLVQEGEELRASDILFGAEVQA